MIVKVSKLLRLMRYSVCVYLAAHVTYSVICLEIVNVLAKDERPQVLAEEFDYVEGVVEAGSVARESVLRQP